MTAAGVLGFFLVAAVLAAVYAGPSVVRTARDGRSALIDGRDAYLRQDIEGARRNFERAYSSFRSASGRLSSPIVWPLRIIPVVGTQVDVSRSLGEVGEGMAQAGIAAVDALDELPTKELRLVEGKVDLPAVHNAIGAFGEGASAAVEMEQVIKNLPEGWVVGFLDRARREVTQNLPGVIDGIRKGQIGLEALPSMLAEGGTKRYLVAFSNLAELRGAGGLFGYVTMLRATDGDLDLEDLSGRPTELFTPPGETAMTVPDWFPPNFREQARIFQNINMTSDFPTVGQMMVNTAEPATGPVDGVIAVDPLGISALLRVTGPITVDAWPVPITADNVARIAMHDVYVRIPNDDNRQDFFSQLVRTTFDRLVSDDIRFRPERIAALDVAAGGGHYRMYSKHPDDQAVFAQLGLAGGVDRTRGATDVLSVISQNGTGNKGDWFLKRNIRYRVRPEPDLAVARTEIDVDVSNRAPSEGLPDYIIGSPLDEVPTGTNIQHLVFLRSRSDLLEDFAIRGEQATLLRHFEGHLLAYHGAVSLPAESSVGLRSASVVRDAIAEEGPETIYRLHVLPQAVAQPDVVDIEIEAPRGWRVHGQTRFRGELDRDVVLEVRFEQTRRSTVVDKIFLEPWHHVRNFLGRIWPF